MFKFALLLLPISLFSQIKITGNVKDDLGNNINGASVMLNMLEMNRTLAYDITDEEGNFEITTNSDLYKFNIIVRVLGFKKQTKLIDNKSQRLVFNLTPEVTELKEIIVKSIPITRKGDTISYNVSSFANNKDKTIGDVLSKMPGIDVLSDGKILYQGKPINKYYIEGLDLLEGKYDVANKNLPFTQVAKVQILENHQPIKVLDSLVYSDNAALNIKLKNKVSFTGQAIFGIGNPPFLWENNITPMLFTKAQQMITSYQSNNTGNNVSSQLKTLTINDLIDNYETSNEKKDWLSTQQLNSPLFSEKRWLNNNIHLITTNYLQKLKNDLELRLNISYLNDFQKQKGDSKTLLFTQFDTIKIIELTDNRIFNNSLQGNVTLQKNTSKKYFKNSTQFQGYWDSQNNYLINQNTLISQNLENNYFNISNKLKSILMLGKQLLTIHSFNSYNILPQTLLVSPGQFNVLLNNNTPYHNVKQDVMLKGVFSNNSVGFTKQLNHFTLTPKIGFLFENQELETRLLLDGNILTDREFCNNLQWQKAKTYVETRIQFKKNKWRFEVNTPLNYTQFNVKDIRIERGEVLNKLTFEPDLSITNDITSLWKLNSSIGFKNQFGTIDGIHYAYILKNYRSIQRVNSVIPQSVSQNYNVGISYRNPVKSLFGTIFYSQSYTNENLLYSTQISSSGGFELQAIEKKNTKENSTLSGRMSKYISSIKTNFTVTTLFSKLTLWQFLNDVFAKIYLQNTTLSMRSNTNVLEWFDMECQINLGKSKNKILNQNNDAIRTQSYQANFNIYPSKTQYIGLKTEFLKTKLISNTNFFADLVYRYNYKKKNTDIELQYSNIFNTQNYQTIDVYNYSYVETNFTVRPAQLLLKIRVSL